MFNFRDRIRSAINCCFSVLSLSSLFSFTICRRPIQSLFWDSVVIHSMNVPHPSQPSLLVLANIFYSDYRIYLVLVSPPISPLLSDTSWFRYTLCPYIPLQEFFSAICDVLLLTSFSWWLSWARSSSCWWLSWARFLRHKEELTTPVIHKVESWYCSSPSVRPDALPDYFQFSPKYFLLSF